MKVIFSKLESVDQGESCEISHYFGTNFKKVLGAV